MSRVATVLTHRRANDTAAAVGALVAAARRADVVLRFDAEETRKHGLEPREGLELDAELSRDVDLCVVMGGDGTILTALREYANTGVPVFAVNFGEVGFLATLDPDDRVVALGPDNAHVFGPVDEAERARRAMARKATSPRRPTSRCS